MKIMKLFFLITFLLLPLSLAFGEEKIVVKINFIDLKVPEILQQGNATFSILFTFKVDNNGSPKDILIIRNFNEIIRKEDLAKSMKSWVIKGFNDGEEFFVSYLWVHSKGWSTIRFITKGFEQTINKY